MNQLQVIEQKLVPFGDYEILAVKTNDGKIRAAVRWICEGIGLTRGRINNEIKKVQEDLVLKQLARNLVLDTGRGFKEVLCLEIDGIPLWLAKISITPKMQEENPETVKNLVNYQLKAKDVLAAAFLPKETHDPITLALEAALETRKQVQSIQTEVIEVKSKVEELEENIYITSSQAKAIRQKVSEKVYEVLGGKNSNAFKHLRKKTYSACWRDFWNYFDINEYRELPRVKFEEAIRFLIAWQPNTILRLEIEHYNTQLELRLVK